MALLNTNKFKLIHKGGNVVALLNKGGNSNTGKDFFEATDLIKIAEFIILEDMSFEHLFIDIDFDLIVWDGAKQATSELEAMMEKINNQGNTDYQLLREYLKIKYNYGT